jgi:PHD/YefM family antitoxin component YafN of YafNO toxin-antitoxin module
MEPSRKQPSVVVLTEEALEVLVRTIQERLDRIEAAQAEILRRLDAPKAVAPARVSRARPTRPTAKRTET